MGGKGRRALDDKQAFWADTAIDQGLGHCARAGA